MEFKLLDSLDRMAGAKAHAGAMIMFPGNPAFTEHDYDKIAREGYQRNPFVYSALNFSGDVFADVDLKLIRSKGEDVKEIDDHPALDILDRPNEDQGGASFKKELYIYLKLAGKSYTQILSPEGGRNQGMPRQLVNWVPSKAVPIKGENTLIDHFQRIDTQREYAKEDVIYIKEFHPTEPANGHPAAMSASRVVDVSNKQLEWNYSILDNKGAPSYVFKGSWTQEQAKQWQRNMERRHSGEYNAGRDLYLPDSVSVDKIGFDSRELDWLEGLKEMKRIIYSIYGVPSELMNDGENKTYSNVENAIRSMIYHNTLPAWRIVLDALNNQLLPRFGENLKYEVDMDSITSLQESMMEKIEKSVKLYEGNLTNKGEARKMADLDDDVPDADRTILRSSFIPDGFTSEDATPETEEELNMNGQEDG